MKHPALNALAAALIGTAAFAAHAADTTGSGAAPVNGSQSIDTLKKSSEGTSSTRPQAGTDSTKSRDEVAGKAKSDTKQATVTNAEGEKSNAMAKKRDENASKGSYGTQPSATGSSDGVAMPKGNLPQSEPPTTKPQSKP